ncbi:MAG: BREX-1 system adenine-specific DNA-methyltransferase PglX [Sulfuricellaceae bacterium]|nr:BREX-1 system adenine-specific DNA-methyltransferase PglX [Sulfuricellaceae bacterium]
METTKLRRFAQYARRTLLELIEARLQLVLQADSAARRENLTAVKQLEAQIQASSREQVIDRVAYTWFNRFCALRYMDVNRVNRISVVSPLDGQFQPEILAEAKMGHIDEERVPAAIQAKVRALLDGTAPSPDPQQEAYRLLVVAACNHWQPAMPFLFERIADYTELLMPDDLLSGNSILSYTREAMTPDACQDVEVIGWLYQFYISEKKDAVFEGLKKNKKITPENIPAATQLFTPHWIVRYLVENSLGRLWLLNRPNSRLAGQMDYFIAPQEPVTDFLRIAKPEDIKLCDPACGSGHMLTYAFDLLYAIYEEEGADPAEISEKILTHNLYGIEIDERAAELAAFALTMKALQYDKRFFRRRANVSNVGWISDSASTKNDVCALNGGCASLIHPTPQQNQSPCHPNICVLRPVKIAPHDLDAYMAAVGRDLFTANLRTLLTQFEEADNFGSLIRPVAMDYAEIRRVLAEKGIGNQLLLEHVHRDVLRVLEQAEYLSQRYQVVVANPPYMGSANFNPDLRAFLEQDYKVTRSDLYAIFVERSLRLLAPRSYLAMVTMQGWMFTKSYEHIRSLIVESCHINTLAQLGTKAFEEISGEIVQTCAFVLQNTKPQSASTTFIRLVEGDGKKKNLDLLNKDHRYQFKQSEFLKIPGNVMVYWTGDLIVKVFEELPAAGEYGEFREGIHTGQNDSYLRYWWEISRDKFSIKEDSYESIANNRKKWIPYNKGGAPIRWYGGNEWVISFDDESRQSMAKLSGHVRPSQGFYFKEGATWPDVSSGKFAVKHYPAGYLFDAKGPVFVGSHLNRMISVLNSKTFVYLASLMMPTLAFKCGTVKTMPVPKLGELGQLDEIASELISISRTTWDEGEESWDFSGLPLLHNKTATSVFSNAVRDFNVVKETRLTRFLDLELKNNQITASAYGLSDITSPEVDASEVSIGFSSEVAQVTDFVSYAVGCMFGRYSLDKPGLILANQGESLEDYLRQVPQPRFTPDADNVIPLLDGDWFPDDITGRFREFLRITFGDAHYDENLRFIETALGKKGKPLPIRDFFLKEFYSDHVKRYKKRPIYWLFSSPKGSFNALIYLHRYRPDTVSVVLQYLRDFRSKLAAHRAHLEQVSISTSASQGEKTRALKEIETLKKAQSELDDYERDTLYPLATHQVALDLDDGVKVNYLKLGAALKKIPGLDAKDEE